MSHFPTTIARLCALSLLMLGGCRNTPHYRLQGKVLAKDSSVQVVTVAHKEIPGLMAAMTMPYAVKDEAAYRELVPGDSIAADLVATDQAGHYQLENIVITDTRAAGPAASAPVNRLTPGATMPDVMLINQDGQQLHLSQFRGKAVLITFIYTRCPLPNFCPRLSAQFAALHHELSQSPDDLARTHLISITLDPKYDTPAMLRQYGLAYAGDASGFQHWDFASMPPADLKTLANAVGLDYEEDSGLINHTMNTVLISPSGVLLANWEGSQWKTSEVLAALKRAAAGS